MAFTRFIPYGNPQSSVTGVTVRYRTRYRALKSLEVHQATRVTVHFKNGARTYTSNLSTIIDLAKSGRGLNSFLRRNYGGGR